MVRRFWPVLLVLALSGCGGQREAGGGSAGSQTARPTSAASPPESARQLTGFLPDSDAVAGWVRSREPRRFGPGNLWEFIDGAAETYLAFGFQELVTADYTRSDGLQAAVDLYRMGDALGTFGIYAQESSGQGELLPLGVEGYRRSTVLAFWAGTCYVKITAFKEVSGLAAALQALADFINRRIGPPGARPKDIDRFPARNLKARSVRYVPKDVLGQSYLTGGFEADYQDGKTGYKLIFIPFASAEEATQALARYRDFVAASGRVRKDLSSPGNGGFLGEDGFYGPLVAARSESFIGIALGVRSEQAGRSALAHLLTGVDKRD